MELKKLVTMTFAKNVGPLDRVLRLLSGAALVAAGWALSVPAWAAASLIIFGLMWSATGVTSRCSIYYMLGYSTCPVAPQREQSAPSRFL